MKKKPLFDVSLFNRIADKHNIPWIDRLPMIETICWGSKGWLDSALLEKIDGRWRGARKNGVYAKCMVDILKALNDPKDYQFA